MKQVMVGIIGGKLRGAEACYLARQAGYEITLFDQDPYCAAADLADVFVCADLLKTDVSDDLADCDFILPMLENPAVLDRITTGAEKCGVPCLHDPASAEIGSSAQWTGQLCRARGIPYMQDFRETGSLLSDRANSAGLHLMPLNREDSDECCYSIEVIGEGSAFLPIAVTRILRDGRHGCCQVEAGVTLPPEAHAQMLEIAEKVGEALRLCGICSVETVWKEGRMYVRSIDTRLPSQIPTAVYQATGINMLSLLYDTACGRLSGTDAPSTAHAVCRHIAVDGTEIRLQGERVMEHAGRLQYTEYFFGCPEVLTDFRPGKTAWSATLIMRDADSLDNVYAKLDRVIGKITQHLESTYRAAVCRNYRRAI